MRARKNLTDVVWEGWQGDRNKSSLWAQLRSLHFVLRILGSQGGFQAGRDTARFVRKSHLSSIAEEGLEG